VVVGGGCAGRVLFFSNKPAEIFEPSRRILNKIMQAQNICFSGMAQVIPKISNHRKNQ